MSLARLIALFTIAALSPIGDAAATTRVPPAEYRPKSPVAKAAVALTVPSGRTHRIVLGEPAATERAALDAAAPATNRAGRPPRGQENPLVSGFPRASNKRVMSWSEQDTKKYCCASRSCFPASGSSFG